MQLENESKLSPPRLRPRCKFLIRYQEILGSVSSIQKFLPKEGLRKIGRARLAVALRPYLVAVMFTFDAGGKVTILIKIIADLALLSCA